MSRWDGSLVSLKCGSGTYQGEIITATNNSISLKKVFCNGIPLDVEKINIRAADILDLQLIEKPSAPPPTAQSTVTVSNPTVKRAGRSHSLSEHPNTNKNIQPDRQNNYEPTKNTAFCKRDKNKQKYVKGWKDEACFGSPMSQPYNQDFDFEKNLALFDKQAVFDEINAHKPDLVKHADQKKNSKYRHDENVIASGPTALRQISVPKQEFCEYVTDEGLIIPSITRTLRKKLLSIADRIGLGWERRTELMGRAITEMAVQLLGGAHRLNPHNTHQWPKVVFLCGSNRQGAMGLNAARQLSSQGVETIVYISESEASFFNHELSLYKLTKNKIIKSLSDLPPSADLIVTALFDEADNQKCDHHLSAWINNNKAAVLSIDPPASGVVGVLSKFSLVSVLPLAHSVQNGKIYLCNLGFPVEIFAEVGIRYKSPFGSKFVIPLHPNDG